MSLLDNSSDFIGIADPAGKPIYLNAAGRRMIGLAPDFPIDQIAIEDCYPPELLSFVKDVILATMRERGQWKGETFFQNVSTHAKIPVSDTHFMIRDASGERILGLGTVTRDISDARRVAEEREQLLAREQRARRDAERAVVARDSIHGIVAHDLRNPLSVILMQAELLERDNPEFERRDQTPRLVLTRSAERMNSLIQDLLDVAVMENGKLPIEPRRLSAGDLAREAVESQAALASSSGLQLRLEVHPDVHDVLGDRKRLLQVFDNLIGNALKFTPKGGCITVEATGRDGEVVFSVADTGPGIARESLQHIFEPFWQAATRAGRLGAGLGLPITRGIVDAHGGRIWVESELERGSTFFFAIPTAPAEKDGSSAVKPAGLATQRRDSRRPRRQRS